MRWCPKCKCEYRDDIDVCSDCGTALVDSLSEAHEYEEFIRITKDKAAAEKLLNYLKYSKIDCTLDQDDESYVILVNPKDLKMAKKYFKAFYEVEFIESSSSPKDHDANDELSDDNTNDFERKYQDETDKYDWSVETDSSDADEFDKDEFDTDSISDSDDQREDSPSEENDVHYSAENNENDDFSAPPYVKKEDQAKDLRTTAFTFLAFGILGILVVLLNIFGAFSFLNGIVAYIVLTIVFIGCIIISIQSFMSSKKADSEAVQENELTMQLNNWLTDNITLSYMNGLTDKIKESADTNLLTAPEVYLYLTNSIKKYINDTFGEIDNSYVESLIEEYYSNNFNGFEENFVTEISSNASNQDIE